MFFLDFLIISLRFSHKMAEKKAEEFDELWLASAELIVKAGKSGDKERFLTRLKALALATGVADEFRNEGKRQAEQTQRGRSPSRGRSKSPARGRSKSPARGRSKSPARVPANAQNIPCRDGDACVFHGKGKCRFKHELNTRRSASPTGEKPRD